MITFSALDEDGTPVPGFNNANPTVMVNNVGLAETSFELPLSDTDKELFFNASVTAMVDGNNKTFVSNQMVLSLIGVKDIVSLALFDQNGEPLGEDGSVMADGTSLIQLEARVFVSLDEFEEITFTTTTGVEGTFRG